MKSKFPLKDRVIVFIHNLMIFGCKNNGNPSIKKMNSELMLSEKSPEQVTHDLIYM